jgi:hypothetical protein
MIDFIIEVNKKAFSYIVVVYLCLVMIETLFIYSVSTILNFNILTIFVIFLGILQSKLTGNLKI